MNEVQTAVEQVLSGVISGSDETPTIKVLGDYLQFILEWNSRVDLVAPAEPSELVERHLADSLLAWKMLEQWWRSNNSDQALAGTVLDVGTGAGLPGVVWAISNRERWKVLLLEPREKRVQFLKEVRRRLELANIEIAQERLEKLTPQTLGGGVSVMVCRALGEPELFLKASQTLLSPQGVAVMMIGPEQQLPQKPAAVLRYQLPQSGAGRAIAIFRRESC